MNFTDCFLCVCVCMCNALIWPSIVKKDAHFTTRFAFCTRASPLSCQPACSACQCVCMTVCVCVCVRMLYACSVRSKVCNELCHEQAAALRSFAFCISCVFPRIVGGNGFGFHLLHACSSKRTDQSRPQSQP